MADTVQFVDKIDASPTVALDLNDGTTWRTLRPVDMSPPPLRRSIAGTLLLDGSIIPASAYDNRILRLTLRVSATNEANLATQLTKLHRELDKAKNIIKYQRDGGAAPVFFRTFRSPDYTLDSSAPDPIVKVNVTIIAEPFAYGLRVDSASITVQNDPADASPNQLFFEITGVTGDVPTPALFVIGFSQVNNANLFAIRRHGTPAVPYVTQAEAMTQGTDTTKQANDAAMSGAGNNFSRTTFATATMTLRLTVPAFPASGSSLEYRGTYRIFARLRKQTAGDTMAVRMGIAGPSGPTTDPVTLPSKTGPFLLDLGLLAVPSGPDPIFDGYSGVEKLADSYQLRLEAERTSGSGNLDWDYLVAVPADEDLVIVKWSPAGAGGTEWVVDGPNDTAYLQSTSDEVSTQGQEPPAVTGSVPLLAPNQINRIAVLRDVGIASPSDDITATVVLIVSYWPRFLYVR